MPMLNKESLAVETLKKPRLRIASPLIFWTVLGYSVINIILGFALFLAPVDAHYFLVGLLPVSTWGGLFGAVGVFSAASLICNNWAFVRTSMGIGLFFKMLWLFALINGIWHGSSVYSAVMWAFLAYIQLLTIIFFPHE